MTIVKSTKDDTDLTLVFVAELAASPEEVWRLWWIPAVWRGGGAPTLPRHLRAS